MRIFFSPDGGDPMLLDSAIGLNALHQRLAQFIAGDETSLSLPAEADGNPAPYREFLPGLRIVKGEGTLLLSLASDRWLELRGSAANLLTYAGAFSFESDEESGHHHPDFGGHMNAGSMRLIVEADDSWEVPPLRDRPSGR